METIVAQEVICLSASCPHCDKDYFFYDVPQLPIMCDDCEEMFRVSSGVADLVDQFA